MTPCVVAFPCSIGDTVAVHGEPGWIIVGLCKSDCGQTLIVEKGMRAMTAHLEEILEDTKC